MCTESSMAANMERGFCPKNRSAVVVPSGRVRRKLWTAVRYVRFLGRTQTAVSGDARQAHEAARPVPRSGRGHTLKVIRKK